MESIKDYIVEKLRINKNLKSYISDFCIVVPYNDLYEEFCNEFMDSMVHGSLSRMPTDIFLIKKSDLKKWVNDPNLYAYEIPDKYNDLEEVEQAYLDELIDIEKLEDADLRDI